MTKRVPDAPYLYEKNGNYFVRVQVPKPLWPKLRKRELVRYVGSNLTAARRVSHATIAEFQGLIAAAKSQGIERRLLADAEIEDHLIDKAIFDYDAHHRRLNRERDSRWAYASESQREERLAGIREEIGFWKAIDIADETGVRAAEARWYCEQLGWRLDENGRKFHWLCEGLQRSALDALRAREKHLMADRSPLANADPLFDPNAKPVRRQSEPTIGELIKRYENENAVNWSPSTKKNYRIIFRVLQEVGGAETAAKDIDRTFCVNLRDTLMRLPSNYQKKPRTRGRPIKEVLTIAEQYQMPTISIVSVNKHLNQFRSIIKSAREDGTIKGNPMSKLELHDPIPEDEKRDPFTQQQLNKIFNSPPWLEGPSGQIKCPERYWVPLIALFTGARLGEVAALRCSEIVAREGVLIIQIRTRFDRKTKTHRSRSMPVHRQLIKLGLPEFIQSQIDADQEFLFPNCKASSLGQWGRNISYWFSNLVREMKFEGNLLTMHSLRHTFEDRLREADLHGTPIGDYLAGRKNKTISANYGEGYSTAKLAEAIERINFPELCLDHLIPTK